MNCEESLKSILFKTLDDFLNNRISFVEARLIASLVEESEKSQKLINTRNYLIKEI